MGERVPWLIISVMSKMKVCVRGESDKSAIECANELKEAPVSPTCKGACSHTCLLITGQLAVNFNVIRRSAFKMIMWTNVEGQQLHWIS